MFANKKRQRSGESSRIASPARRSRMSTNDSGSATMNQNSNGKRTLEEFGKMMRSEEFLEAPEKEKFAAIGDALDDGLKWRKKTEKRMARFERSIGDVARQESKYCLVLRGKDVPRRPKGKQADPIAYWDETMRMKFGITLDKEEKLQFVGCHWSDKGDSMIARFNTTTLGSYFDRCCYRPGNWNGENSIDDAAPRLDIRAERVCSKHDSKIHALAGRIRYWDKKKEGKKCRVKRFGVTKGGFVSITDGTGATRRLPHIDDAEALLTEQEKLEWKNGRTRGGEKNSD